MIFWTWRSYFICWQIFENKVLSPVGKKRRRYFHFLLSLAHPIDRLDWALSSVVILFHHLFPLLEKVEIQAFSLPRDFPAVLIIFTGRAGAENPPSPQRGAGRGVHPWYFSQMNPTSANATWQEDIDWQGERWDDDDGKGIGDGLECRGMNIYIATYRTWLWWWMEEKADSTTRRKSTQLTINSIDGSFQFSSAARVSCANNFGACTL